MLHDVLREIAQAGVLAPSADNEHVFRLELKGDTVVLWPSEAFAACHEPLRRVLGLISLGAVVENMRLRASQLGLIAQAQWFTANAAAPMAQISLTAMPTVTADPLATAIAKRHTNRKMYGGPALTGAEADALTEAATGAEGAQLLWLHGVARRQALRLIWQAESERFLRQQLHRDLFSSIRFDLSWTASAAWALPPAALEIEAPIRPLFKALRHWSIMKPLTKLGLHRLIGWRAGWLPAWQAPALGLVMTALPTEPGALASGAALQRVWLCATQLGLAVQPLAASAVLVHPADAIDGASAQLRTALRQGWQAIAPGQTPMMVVRVGRATAPTVTSGRRALVDYLIAPHASAPNTVGFHYS